ncbi:MAG: phosphopyruvate hydratase [Candidatus Pacebacteria bacterium]|jgi:enolase|nr:phosphopyruvate hydratase [Candidatus Paceibacterota bacterium]MBT4652189.1 phosphopyruvate hydratase [Candidatus Paceibacterota bacterium]MBT6756620.1 phosphopyruvate hydratase [Candidatus Paceibacterota bacterium]MBT6920870.1 phosphopyruvate hydratase [Candidatus Paceibacterota bacterium]
MKITHIHGRQVLDSRGNPTIEVEVTVEGNHMGRTTVPSGASTGTHEALELRDGSQAYLGQGVLKAVENVNTTLSQALVGNDYTQDSLDNFMIELDGTEKKEKIGANAILGVSLAFAWASSAAQGRPLYEYIGELYGTKKLILPRPMLNILNGGKHANWATDIQEYMVMPMTAPTWDEKLRTGAEIFQHLQKILKEKGYSTNVGNEGGFAPAVKSNTEALDLIVEAIDKAGYSLGDEVMIGFDAAATEFYNPETKNYELKRDQKILSSEEMVEWVIDLSRKYPVASFEDMLAEDDWAGWTSLTEKIGSTIQNVGDDLLVTNTKRIEEAITKKACNSLLVKLNQIGTLTETLQAMKLSENAGWTNVVSHRSGETEDVTIAHLVVGTGAGQIKTGAPSRGERTAKYNELTRIAEKLEK